MVGWWVEGCPGFGQEAPKLRGVHLVDPALLGLARQDDKGLGLHRAVHGHLAALRARGADLVVCTSSVAGAAAERVAVPGLAVLRVNRPMIVRAVADATATSVAGRGRVGVVATLPEAVVPARELIEQTAALVGARVAVVPVLQERAWTGVGPFSAALGAGSQRASSGIPGAGACQRLTRQSKSTPAPSHPTESCSPEARTRQRHRWCRSTKFRCPSGRRACSSFVVAGRAAPAVAQGSTPVPNFNSLPCTSFGRSGGVAVCSAHYPRFALSFAETQRADLPAGSRCGRRLAPRRLHITPVGDRPARGARGLRYLVEVVPRSTPGARVGRAGREAARHEPLPEPFPRES